jgi:hypothetical protein
MFSNVQEKTREVIEDATDYFRRPSRVSSMSCGSTSGDTVRSAGILLLAASAGAVALMVYRSCPGSRRTSIPETGTPQTDDDYDDVDQTGMDSFPASDPPSYNAGPAR